MKNLFHKTSAADKIAAAVKSPEEAREIIEALEKKFPPDPMVDGFSWTDVQSLAEERFDIEELPKEDCLAVLQIVEKRKDANNGVDWDFIEYHLGVYLREPRLVK